jgi:hypothetical protein
MIGTIADCPLMTLTGTGSLNATCVAPASASAVLAG